MVKTEERSRLSESVWNNLTSPSPSLSSCINYRYCLYTNAKKRRQFYPKVSEQLEFISFIFCCSKSVSFFAARVYIWRRQNRKGLIRHDVILSGLHATVQLYRISSHRIHDHPAVAISFFGRFFAYILNCYDNERAPDFCDDRLRNDLDLHFWTAPGRPLNLARRPNVMRSSGKIVRQTEELF